MLGIELTPEHDLHRLVDLGVRAEAAGYDAVYSTCHYNNRDPWAFLAAGDRHGLGPAWPGRRQPLRDPPGDARLASRHPRRAVGGPRRLRARPGRPSTLRNLGLEDERGLRPVLEAFKTAQKLWAGERVDHEGTFDAAGAGLNYEPRRAPTFRSTSAARARTCAGWPRNTPTGCCSTARIRRTSRGLASRPTTGLPIDLTIAATSI